MREDEDHFRQYMPVLRRLIILVAVLTAIPVAMWTITAVVRTYVGPPKVPTFRPIAAAPPAVGPNEAAAAPVAAEAGKAERKPVIEANATTGGGDGSGMAGDDATTGRNANATPAAAAPMPAAPDTVRTASLPAANAAANAAPNPANGVAEQFAPEDQQPPASKWPAPPAANWPSPPAAQQPLAAAAPDAQPFGENVPLPRKRPHSFAIAQAHGIPLPRPRPDAAGPAAMGEEQQPTPGDWLRNLFSRQGQQPADAAPAPDGYQAEPH